MPIPAINRVSRQQQQQTVPVPNVHVQQSTQVPSQQQQQQQQQQHAQQSLHRQQSAPQKQKLIASDIVLDNNSPKLDVHSKIRMFPHQQALTAKMVELETAPRRETFIGVLKDPPGSGKSFPLLALMLYEKRQYGRTQNLLVIPHNIHKQWVEYIEQFSDELCAMSLMYYGDITALFYDARALFEYDILITTASFYDMVSSTVRSIGAWFNRVILDEIDSISFVNMGTIPSQVIWLVSASAELTKRGAYIEHARKNGVVCDPTFIKRSINLPPLSAEHHTCYNEYVDILQQDLLSNDDLKALYAVDYTSFKFPYLRNENAVTNPKELLSAKFRNTCIELHSTTDSIKSLEKGVKVRADLPQIMAQKMEKKNDLEKTVDKILKIVARTKCALCCDDYVSPDAEKKRSKTKCCGITFCTPCLSAWFEKISRCPRCCKEVKRGHPFLEQDDDPIDVSTGAATPKDKMETFHEILKKEIARENFRILVFSDMTGTFIKVQEILKKENLPLAEIEGNQYTMDRAIADYKSGKRPVLLVDSQSYGAGMNMEMTTCVIIMHKTEREYQIIGRAQRLGRKDRLYVHHLAYPRE